ncbi:hypothetical protein B0H11DRAFT_1928496 [Mycena galericulata]|nr:hypothetical protein B0H11DRAFT_1928496 [Mycena galericulata]
MAGIFYGNVGEIPESEVRMVDDVTWVGLNCSVDLLPPNAMHYINTFSYHTQAADFEENGLFTNMEYSLSPDWDQHDRSFRAWIPVVRSREVNDKDPWFLQIKDGGKIVGINAFQKWYIPENHRAVILQNLRDMEGAVSDICSKAPFHGKQPRPSSFYYDGLLKARGSAKEACQVLMTARRTMLEYLGFCYWRSSTADNWKEELKDSTIAAIERWNLSQYEKRGVLLNLSRDWHEANLLVFIRFEIPVLFPWTILEESDLRFACLAPSVLSAYQQKRVNAGRPKSLTLSEYVSESPSYLEVCRYSLFLDDPLEPYQPPKEDKRKVVPKKGEKRIIDFPGWAPRTVPSRKWVKFYRKRFHFSVRGTVTTFWRYRPIEDVQENSEEETRKWLDQDLEDFEGETSEDADENEVLDMIDLDELHVVREIYKGMCAPRPGQEFDINTGAQKAKALIGNSCFQQYDSILRKKLPVSTSSRAYQSVRETVEDLARRIRDDGIEDAMDVDSNTIDTPAPTGTSHNAPVSTLGSLTLDLTSSDLESISDTANLQLQFPNPGSSVPSSKIPGSTNPDSTKGLTTGPPSLLQRLSDPGNFPPANAATLKGKQREGNRSLTSRIGLPPPTAPRGMLQEKKRGRSPRESSASSSVRARTSRSTSPAGSRGRRPRPVSPTSGYIRPTPAQKLRMDVWRESTKTLTRTEACKTLPVTFSWDAHFLDHAVLVLETAAVRVRLRFLAAGKKNCSVGEVLAEALTRGYIFKLAIPQSVFNLFRRDDLSVADRVLAKSIYELGHTEEALKYGRGGGEFSISYHGNRVPGGSNNRGDGNVSSSSVQTRSKRLVDVDFDEEESRMKRVFADDWSKIKVRDIVLPGARRDAPAGHLTGNQTVPDRV